jgi:hypothetical protein
MLVSGRSARVPLSAVLVATAFGAIALACDANLETVCFDGQPCVPTGGGGTGGGGNGGGGNGGATTTSTTSTTSATFDPEGDIPCDVFAILEAKCHICHEAQHLNGAPIDLLTCGRFQEADCGAGDPRHLIATTYVNSGFMPLGATDLTDDEKTTVMGWLEQGAPCTPKGDGCTGTAGTKACYE